MTTIAYDGKTIAADSLACGGEYAFQVDYKLFRHKNMIYGCSGESQCVREFRHWLNAGEDPDKRPSFEPGSFNALCVHSNQDVYRLDHRLWPIRLPKPASLGSGCPYAMAAMVAGADAKRAVKIACQLDEGSGGKIRTMTVSTKAQSK